MAYIAKRLDGILFPSQYDADQGERTALDNSMLMLCSSMLTGHHDATQLPVVMLGTSITNGAAADQRAQGEEPGLSQDVASPTARWGVFCDRLFLSMMDKMTSTPKNQGLVGDATKPEIWEKSNAFLFGNPILSVQFPAGLISANSIFGSIQNFASP